MLKFKSLAATVALALALPLALPSAGYAQFKQGGVALAPRGGGGAAIGGGGRGGSTTFVGGFRGSGFRGGGGTGFRAGGGGRHMTAGGGRIGRSGGWHGHHRGRRGGWFPGFVAGAAIGSAFASPYYYGSPYYDDDYYYDEGPAIAVVPDSGSVAYCMRRFKSYNVRTRTYLGYDGKRHPCP